MRRRAAGEGRAAIPAVDIVGVPVHRVHLSHLLGEVEEAARSGRRLTVMYLNVHVANTSFRSPGLRRALRAADLVYCDGEGIRIGARLLGDELPERMTGADLLWEFAARASAAGLSVFWIGGAEGVAATALERMRARFPDLKIAGSHHGYFSPDGVGSAGVLEQVRRATPDVVLVGLGTPAQELWVMSQRQALAAPVVWCVGAAADFVSGRVPRAPAWMHRHGLEWLFRLAVEPRRMFRRYVLGNPLFVARLVRQRVRSSFRMKRGLDGGSSRGGP